MEPEGQVRALEMAPGTRESIEFDAIWEISVPQLLCMGKGVRVPSSGAY